MMNEKHPIDDLFQRGLEQHAVPPPMHIWERIEEGRGSRHRSKLVFVRQKFTIVSSAAAVLLLGVWLNWPESPVLGSFPLAAAGNYAQRVQEEPVNTRLESSLQQASLLPDVRQLIHEAGSIREKTATGEPAPATTVPLRPLIAAKSGTPAIPEPETTAKAADLPQTAAPSTNTSPAIATTAKAATLRLPSAPAKTNNYSSNRTGTLIPLDVTPIPVPVPETGCARFSEGRPAVFFALTAGPSLPIRRFSAKDDEHDNYAAQRANTETANLSYETNARLSVVFPWGGAVRSGLSFTHLNEELVYKNSRVRQTIITEIYGPNGEVIGTDTTNVTDTTILKYHNRYRLLDIPLQLGYEVRYNKITVAANLGASLNVAFNQRGNYLGPQDLLPTRFDSDDPDTTPVYKTKVGLGFHASLGLHYQLNDRLDLMAEPYFRYYPKSFTRDDYPLNQKYVVAGVGFGLRVLL